MFKIINYKDYYKVVDSTSDKLWGNFSKKGFTKKRVKELMEKFNWKSKDLRKKRDKKIDKRKKEKNG